MHRRPRFTLLSFLALALALLAPAALAGPRADAGAGLQPLDELKLVAIDGAAGDNLGFDVAYSGGVSLAGAPYRAVGGNAGQGAAYVFRHSGELFTQDELTASDGAAQDAFGFGTDIDGATIVVGAPGHDVGGNADQGAAYVFTYSEGSWTQQAKLTASDGTGGDNFGSFAGISGDTIAVSAPYKKVGANDYQGVVYVFARSGDDWTQQAALTADDAQAYDYLGFTFGIDGDTVVAGAQSHQVGANAGQGASYVFARSGGVWSQQAMLTAADGEAGDSFGWTNGIDGDTVVVGAYSANAGTGGSYVFTRTGGVWSQQAELTAPGLVSGDAFGSGAGIDGDLAVVGAQYQTIGGNAGQGAAYVYTRTGDTWSEPTQLVASDGGAGDNFGWWIQAEGNTVLIGAPFSIVEGNAAQGAAYLYAPSEGPSVVVNGPTARWQRRPAGLQFTAIPSEGGAPVAATQYWIDGVTHMWTPASKLRVTSQGVTRVQVRAVDVNGTPGPVVTRTVRIDSKRPRVQARPAAGAAGSVVRLHYRVRDARPGCGHALVRLVVSDASGRVLTKSSTRPATTNAWHTMRISTRALSPGTYRVALRARDAAGNFQRGLTVTTLQVR
jgi:hypothetical protein